MPNDDHKETLTTPSSLVTGGIGFNYEDHVAASIMAAMLADQPPFGEEIGPIESIDWQVSDDGWKFDDLLLTATGNEQRKIAVSCKMPRYVTAKGWPVDAVDRLWEQWEGSSPKPFRHGTDLLAVVTSKLGVGPKSTWDTLLQEAIKKAPARFLNRYGDQGKGSRSALDFVKSLQGPDTVDNEPEERVKLIRSLRLWHRDFLKLDSTDTTKAVEWCRQALIDESRTESLSLWNSLVLIASEYRVRGGTLGHLELVRKLINSYSFKTVRDHVKSWRTLDVHSAQLMSSVEESIGNSLCLTRQSEMASLRTMALPGHLLLVVGESGAGKSALVKRLASEPSQRIWLSAMDVEAETLGEVKRRLEISHSFSELLKSNRSADAILVIDGVERLSESGRRNAIGLAVLAVNAALPWRVIFTLHEIVVDNFMAEYSRASLISHTPVVLRIDSIKEAVVDNLLSDLPLLVSKNPTRSLLRALQNLKIMDMVVGAKAKSGLESFPDLVSLIWRGIVGEDDASARASILKRVGKLDAKFFSGAPSSHINGSDEQRVAEKLVQDGVLVFRNERYIFRHDLIGDWARLLMLIESGDEVAEFLRSIDDSFRWRPAIRLFAEWLAQNDKLGKPALFALLRDESLVMAKQSLHEGLFGTPGIESIVEELVLGKNEFKNKDLESLLRIFLSVSTRPSDMVKILRRDHPEAAAMRALFRTPIPDLWHDVIKVLDKNRDDVVLYAPILLGTIARTWLIDDLLVRNAVYSSTTEACARIAVSAARELQARLAVRYTSDIKYKPVFEALLLASPWYGDEVSQIALGLAKRRADPPEIVERVNKEREHERKLAAERRSRLSKKQLAMRMSGSSMGIDRHIKRKPFTDGPHDRVASSFRDAVMEPGMLVRFATSNPSNAHEVLLACCLEDPGVDDPLYTHRYTGSRTGTNDAIGSYPPHYYRGPWLALLTRVPSFGLDAVIRLVEIGTGEWLRLTIPKADSENYVYALQDTTFQIQINGAEKSYRGNTDVFTWHQGHGHGGNYISSALMATEKWLYTQLEQEQSVDTAIKKILRQSTSVSMLGMLVEVAKKNPQLLRDQLKSLISSWRVIYWDMRIAVQSQVQYPDIFGLKALNGWMDDEAEKWSKMPHRSHFLRDQIVILLVNGEQEIVDACAESRALWNKELAHENCHDPDSIKRLIAILDPENLTLIPTDNNQVQIQIDWPAELQENTSEQSNKSNTIMLAFSLKSRMRQILDAQQYLSDEQAEVIWKTVQSVSSGDVDNLGDDQLLVCSSVISVAAVLEMLAREWLDKHPERRSWLEEKVLEHPSLTGSENSLTYGMSLHNEHVEAFIGEWAIARLATGDQRVEIRKRIVESMTADEHIVTGQVLSAAIFKAKDIPDDFDRIFNLLWFWAALSLHQPRWGGDGSWIHRIAQVRRQRLIDAFVGRSILNQALDWKDYRLRAARWALRIQRRRRKDRVDFVGRQSEHNIEHHPIPRKWEECPGHGFDWSLLERVGGKISYVVRPSIGPELSPLIDYDHRLLDLVVFSLLHSSEDNLPNSFERSVTSRMCQIIAAHEDDDFAQGLWSKISRLLPSHPKWCEAFFDSWFSVSRDEKASARQFHQRWKFMVDSVESMPEWGVQNEHWSYDQITVWSALLGLHDVRSSHWSNADSQYIKLHREKYARWALFALDAKWNLESFCIFLQNAAAKEIRLKAVVWVHQALKNESAHQLDEERVYKEILKLCHIVWHEQSKDILAVRDSRDALLELVSTLTKQHVSGAVELRTIIEEATGSVGS